MYTVALSLVPHDYSGHMHCIYMYIHTLGLEKMSVLSKETAFWL